MFVGFNVINVLYMIIIGVKNSKILFLKYVFIIVLFIVLVYGVLILKVVIWKFKIFYEIFFCV